MRVVTHLAAYFAASVASSAVLTIWMACIEFSGPMAQQLGLIGVASEASRVWPYIFGLTLLVMFLPWCLMMGVSSWLPFRGPVYCASGTALAALLAFGCTGGLLPGHGTSIYLDGFVLAVKTTGLPIFVSGATGGLIYWLVRERDKHLKKVRSVSAH